MQLKRLYTIKGTIRDMRPLRALALHVRFLAAALVLALSLGLPAIGPAGAQPAPGPEEPRPAPVEEQTQAEAPLPMPGFWDPRRRPERPDTSRIMLIRFMTENDYPPFNYAGADGNPAGFNVDLARMVCEELKIACTIQMRRFDTLIDALGDNRGDAVIASIAPTPETRRRVDFSDPYYRTPARFVARRDLDLPEVTPEALRAAPSPSSPARHTRPI